jgi:hypothetical protein
MPENPVLHTHTALAGGLRELLMQLEARLSLQGPVNARLVRCVGRAYLPDMGGSIERMRVFSGPMSGRYARPTPTFI